MVADYSRNLCGRALYFFGAIAGGGLAGVWLFVLLFSHGPPVLRVRSSVIEFGKIPAGLEVSRSVEIMNSGESDLVISKIRTGCGCTKATVAPETPIAPGDAAFLTVSFVADHSVAANGKVATIYVFSNDPKSRITRLIARAQPEKSSVEHQEIVDFGRILDKKKLPVSREIAFYGFGEDQDASAYTVEDRLNQPYIRLKEIRRDTETVIYRVSLLPDAPTGDICTNLTFRNARSGAGIEGTVTVRGQVLGTYVAIPQMVVIGPMRSHDPAYIEKVRIKQRNCGAGMNSISVGDINAIRISDNLRGLVSCTAEAGDDCVALTVAMVPRDFVGVWSDRRVLGSVTVDLRSASARTEWLNIPVLVTTTMPKIHD